MKYIVYQDGGLDQMIIFPLNIKELSYDEHGVAHDKSVAKILAALNAPPVPVKPAVEVVDAVFERALKSAWEMVDVLRPAGQPGSYNRGHHNGIVDALTQLRANYEFERKKFATTPSVSSTESQRPSAVGVSGSLGGAPLIARSLAEWHEDDGPVLWWAWCGKPSGWAGEPAWAGQPTDSDWPGYHTHWTPHLQMPIAPVGIAAMGAGGVEANNGEGGES